MVLNIVNILLVLDWSLLNYILILVALHTVCHFQHFSLGLLMSCRGGFASLRFSLSSLPLQLVLGNLREKLDFVESARWDLCVHLNICFYSFGCLIQKMDPTLDSCLSLLSCLIVLTAKLNCFFDHILVVRCAGKLLPFVLTKRNLR